MTIEARGHVHAIEFVGVSQRELVLTLEASRLPNHPHRVTISAEQAEIDSYNVGMSVVIQIRPA